MNTTSLLAHITVKIWLIFMTVGFAGPAYSMDKLTFAEVDRLTLKYYNEAQWDSLLVVGKEALKEGIDYFYLRARMGAAYFEKGRYAQAITQYRKAQQFNEGDPYVNQSLYISLLRLGETELATANSTRLTASGKKDLDIHNPVIRSLSLGGIMTWSKASRKPPENKLMGRDSICGYRDIYGNYYGGDLGLTIGITPHLFVDAGYTYMNFKKQSQYQYAWFEDSLVRHVDTTWGYYNIWAYPRYSAIRTFDYTVNQQEFFIAPRLITNNGWIVEPLFHLVYAKYHQTRMTYRMEEVSDTLYHVNDPVFDSIFLFYKDIYGFTQSDTAFTNYLVSLRVSKRWGIIGVGLQGSWSDFNDKQQAQVGMDITYYPLGNTGFYGLTRGTGLFRQGEQPDWILQQMLGVKLTKWLWLEGSVIYGDYSGGNLANGRWVYNMTDRLRYSASGTLIFTLFRQMKVTGTFLHAAKSNPWYQVNLTNQDLPPNHVSTKTTLVNYSTNSLVIGLHWTF